MPTVHTATADTDTAGLVGATLLVGARPHTVLAAWHGLGDPHHGIGLDLRGPAGQSTAHGLLYGETYVLEATP